MKASTVLLGFFCLTVFFVPTSGDDVNIQAKNQNYLQERSQQTHHRSHDNDHRNAQAKHHLGSSHYARHHKGLKARDSNSSVCISICDVELIALVKWFNNTQELKLLFQLIPPSVKKLIFGDLNGTSFNTSSLNGNTTFNGSISINLDLLYDATVQWPILTYLAKLIGYILSRIPGISALFNIFPEFANIWKIVLRGLSSGSGKVEILINNLQELFGFNGTFGGNLFNLTYWENFLSPSHIIQGIENAVEGGIEAFANLSGIAG